MARRAAGLSDCAADCVAERLGAKRNVATATRPRAVFIALPSRCMGDDGSLGYRRASAREGCIGGGRADKTMTTGPLFCPGTVLSFQIRANLLERKPRRPELTSCIQRRLIEEVLRLRIATFPHRM